MRSVVRLISALAIVFVLAIVYHNAARIHSSTLQDLPGIGQAFSGSPHKKLKPYRYPQHKVPDELEPVDIKEVGLPIDDPKIIGVQHTADEFVKIQQHEAAVAVAKNAEDRRTSKPVYQELSDMLKAAERLLSAKVLSAEASLKLNAETCPLQGYNYDRAALIDSHKRWFGYSNAEIQSFRRELVDGLQAMGKQSDEMPPVLVEHRNLVRRESPVGRGIVFSAGDDRALRRVLLNIKIIREHGCVLPVEVFHYPWEVETVPAELKNELEEHNVQLRTVAGGLEKTDGWKDFRIKPLAILQSSFADVLWLDTDSIPLRDPEYLFDSAGFRDSGLLLWPDFTKSQPRNPIWRILGLACRPEFEGESGQIVVDKKMHQATLQLATWFATSESNDKIHWYGHFGGDRDSFRLSAVILGLPFSGPRRLLSIAGQQVQPQPLAASDRSDKDSKALPADVKEALVIQDRTRNLHAAGHTMLQHDLDGQPLFVHGNLIKHGSLPRDQRIWSVVTRLRHDRMPGGQYGQFEQAAPSTTTETFDETLARGGWKSDEDRQKEQEAMYAKAFGHPDNRRHKRIMQLGPSERARDLDAREKASRIKSPRRTRKRQVTAVPQTADVDFGRGVIVHVAQSPLGTMMLTLEDFQSSDASLKVGAAKADETSAIVTEEVKRGDELWEFEDLYLRMGGTT